mgnify:CR=1 FL=1
MDRTFSVCAVLLLVFAGPQVLASPSRLPVDEERLSLSFQDVEVRSVLKVLADFKGSNLVVSDAVQGRVTLRLQDVPWEQALDLVLRSKGLGRRQDGNVLLVAPLAELAGLNRAGGLPAAEATRARDYAGFIDSPHAGAAQWPRDARSRAIALLNALLGNRGRRGGLGVGRLRFLSIQGDAESSQEERELVHVSGEGGLNIGKTTLWTTKKWSPLHFFGFCNDCSIILVKSTFSASFWSCSSAKTARTFG